MSYRFYSIFMWLSAFLFLLTGTFGILIPLSVEIRTSVIQFIFEESLLITVIGASLMLIGSFLIVTLLRSSRRYIKTKVGNNSVTLDEALIQNYLNTYWKELFPHEEIASRYIVKNRKIHIYADLPYMPKDEQKPLSERIGMELGDIVHRLLGYPEEVVLFTRFNKDSTSK